LIEDIIAFSEIKKRGKILDVGCGTGQATVPFAQKGFTVLGVDLGKELVEIARQKCAIFPNAQFMVGSFEDLSFPPQSFDLIISGMAWHWINPGNREEKAFQLLSTKGTIALFWSYQQKQKSLFVQAVGKILDRYGGVDRGPAGSKVRQIADSLYEQFNSNKMIKDVRRKEYDEDLKFTTESYLDLVLSYGWVQALSEYQRSDLICDLQKLFVDCPKLIVVPYQHVLILAKLA